VVAKPQTVYAPIHDFNATGTLPERQRDHQLLNMPSPPWPTPRLHPLPDSLAHAPASNSSIPLVQLLAPRRRQRPGPLPAPRPGCTRLQFEPPWGHLSDYVNKTPRLRGRGVLLLRVRMSPPGITNRPALPEYQHANSVRQLGRLVYMVHHPQDMERVASNSAILLSRRYSPCQPRAAAHAQSGRE
jgi:hypothetical protein